MAVRQRLDDWWDQGEEPWMEDTGDTSGPGWWKIPESAAPEPWDVPRPATGGQISSPWTMPREGYEPPVDFPVGQPAPQTSPEPTQAQTRGYDYVALRDYLFGQGRNLQTPEQLRALLAARPDIASGVEVVGRGDVIRLPDGSLIDVIGNMGDPERAAAAWTGIGGESEAPAPFPGTPVPLPEAPGPGGGGGGGGGGSGGGGGGATGPVAPAVPGLDELLRQLIEQQRRALEERTSRERELSGLLEEQIRAMRESQAQQEERRRQAQAFNEAVRQRMLERMRQASELPTAEDPVIAAQVRAMRSEGERALRQQREALAARAVQQGLPTGAQEAAMQQGYQRLGQQTGAFQAQALAQELGARRAELMNLLNQGAGILTANEAQQLQQQLGLIDAQMRELGQQYARDLGLGQLGLAGQELANRFTLGQGDLDLRRLLGMSDIDLRRQLGLGQLGLGYAQLGEAGRQFNERLGYDIGLQQAMLNQSILRTLFGG